MYLSIELFPYKTEGYLGICKKFYAEDQAERNIPMTMKDWSQKLNAFLQFNERDILQNAGKVTAVIAKEFALSEFEKYKVIQDKSYKSDFDMLLQELDKDGK